MTVVKWSNIFQNLYVISSLSDCLFQSGCVLIQTKEMSVSPDDATRIFGSDSYQDAVGQGRIYS